MPFDIIIVGAGPGGSSAATFLARQGLSVLLLDKAVFPRDKVCGDCLAPQALYWIDQLGCIDEVLDQTNTCITSGDIFLNGRYLFTGGFPQDTIYPGFCTLLDRKRLDNALVKNSVKNGVIFRPGCLVKEISIDDDCVKVNAVSEGAAIQFKGRLVIGADGANSIVSRAIGNTLRDGATAVSVRAYYEGLPSVRPYIQIYIDERFFPGIGWVFVDSRGKANIGIGYIFDKNFPMIDNLKKVFDDFVKSDLKGLLKGAKQTSPAAGWWASFFRPRSVIADRIMLIGDAANLADPINGAGIHKAMESAHFAAQAVIHAAQDNDFSYRALKRYEAFWAGTVGFDWQVRQMLLSFAKNPHLRGIYLLFVKHLAGLAKDDRSFQSFCGGVFSGTIPASEAVSPAVLLDAVPLDPTAWFSLLRNSDNGMPLPVQDAYMAAALLIRSFGKFVGNPRENLSWGAEVIGKMVDVAGLYASMRQPSM